jgi:hypothetical protein
MNFSRKHGNGISEGQLQELLRSLPQAQAPSDLEENLMQRIAAEHLGVAHVLASLIPVSAHPEFDRRLFQAIKEHERKGAIIPEPFPVGTSFATWLKGLSWLRGAIAMSTAVAVTIGGMIVYNADNPPVDSSAPFPSASQSAPSHQEPGVLGKATSSDKPPVTLSGSETQIRPETATSRNSEPIRQRSVQKHLPTTAGQTTTPRNEHPATVKVEQQSTPAESVEIKDSAIQENTPSEVGTGDSVDTGGDMKIGPDHSANDAQQSKP